MPSSSQLEILRQLFRHWVLYDEGLEIDKIKYSCDAIKFEEELKLLDISELIHIQKGIVTITEAGKSKLQIVLTGGAYDLLHKGHIITLKEAKSHGDFLIVVIARDVTVAKKKRNPIHSEKDRAYLLNEICVVDAAILGDEVDHMRVVRRIKPDIVAIGSDQDHLEEVLKAQLKDQGMFHTKIVRLHADYEELATTKLINHILENY